MDMLTFPRVPPPAISVYETHEQFAERIGAAAHGVSSPTASNLIVVNDHVGTHCDARRHIVPTAGGPETIPLEYCISDGVVLDFTDEEPGYEITASDVEGALDRIDYQSRSATSCSSTRARARTTPRSAIAPTTRA
jgi:kynurenine formamidase